MPARTRAVLRPLSCLIIVFMGGCGGGGSDGGDPTPAAIDVAPTSITLSQNGSADLSVTVRDNEGNALSGHTPSFVSSTPAVATVSSTGRVSSPGPKGTAVITVTAAGLEAEVPVTVTATPVSMTVSPASLVITQKDTADLTVTVLDATGDPIPGAPISYVPDAPSAVAVRPDGRVVSLGRAGGSALRLQSDTVVRVIPVTVTAVADTVVMTPDEESQIDLGQTKQYEATVRDLNGDAMAGASITWATSPLGSISPGGLVSSGTTPGRMTVTATHQPSGRPALTTHATLYLMQTAGPAWVPPPDLVALATGGGGRETAITQGGIVVAAGPGGVWMTDVAGFTELDTVVTGFALGMTMNAAGTRAFVAGSEPPVGATALGVGVIDVATRAQVGYLTNGDLGDPYATGVSRDGSLVLLGTSLGNIGMFDAASGAWVQTLRVPGGLLNHFATHPRQDLMYVTSFGGGAGFVAGVFEINLTTRTVRSIPLPAFKPQGVAVSPDGRLLFVADEGGPLRIWDLVRERVAGFIPAANSGFGLTLSRDGTRLFMGGGRIAVIDIASRVVTANHLVVAPRAADGPDGRIVAAGDGFLYRFTP